MFSESSVSGDSEKRKGKGGMGLHLVRENLLWHSYQIWRNTNAYMGKITTVETVHRALPITNHFASKMQ